MASQQACVHTNVRAYERVCERACECAPIVCKRLCLHARTGGFTPLFQASAEACWPSMQQASVGGL
eukprot:3623649-Pleurochrysis_carterae.AAC.1